MEFDKKVYEKKFNKLMKDGLIVESDAFSSY
jgi:hypothetical protein